MTGTVDPQPYDAIQSYMYIRMALGEGGVFFFAWYSSHAMQN